MGRGGGRGGGGGGGQAWAGVSGVRMGGWEGMKSTYEEMSECIGMKE